MADTAMQESLQDDDETLRKRLLARVAVAGLVVVALVGVLTLFDGFYVKEQKLPPRVAAVRPIGASEPRTDEKPVEEKTAGEKPVDEKAAEPQAETERPAPPVVAAEPERTEATRGGTERPLTMPAVPRRAMVRPTEPVATVPSRPELAQEIARVLPPAEQKQVPASRPIARALESVRQFVLQMGVFNNVANAEELRAKLELAGVPAQIEARVQVGPFASRDEAERVRDKLRLLGMEPGLIVAARK